MHKEALETFLKNRLGSLFDLKYDLLLYDVTSTYFQGQANGNAKAQRGYSRDHRGDCKQVCIGLVVARGGMPLGYEVFAGNRSDVTTVEEIVETFILCRGEDRREKEKAMHERFAMRIEEGLKKIEAACARREYKPVTIAKRLGKLLGRNSRAAGLFETDVVQAANGRAMLIWRKVAAWRDWAELSEGR